MLDTILGFFSSDLGKGVIAGIGSSFAILGALWVRYKNRRAFKQGMMREEVTVISNILEDSPDGLSVLLKPRTVQSAQPLMRAFPSPYLVELIMKATKKCKEDGGFGPFIVLDSQEEHDIFMKRVVDICSELGQEGHILRMCGRPIIKNECYAFVTFSPDGEHRKIRIDLISAENLERFLDPHFVEKLTNRPEEGNHRDLIDIFIAGAKALAGTPNGVIAKNYVRRVSIPVKG